eukprot:EG_transcript_21902
MVWSLGPHCQTLLRGYCFRDPQWEADFQVRNRQWALFPMRAYLAGVLAVCIMNALKFQRFPGFHPGIVLYSLLCVCTALLLGATVCSRVVRRCIWGLFTAWCCLVSFFNCYLMPEGAWLTADAALGRYVPALTSIPEDAVVRKEVEWFVRNGIASEAIHWALLFSFCHWAGMTVLGFNKFTLVYFIVEYVPLSIIMFADGIVFLSPPTVVMLIAVTASLGSLTTSVLIERLRRTSFLNEVLLMREMQASQMADSMLNHTLKNLLADVAGTLEVYMAGEAPSGALEDSVTCLRRGMMA